METRQAYNLWASQYDTNQNKTRDLEALALREMLADTDFSNCLEIGCGTGKNTQWIVTKASRITAVDLSEEMLAKAREKVNSPKVGFVLADVRQPWAFEKNTYDLVTFSLILEHIAELEPIFQVASVLAPAGHLYVGELHPFKQYGGTKARFDTADGQTVVDCYNHNLSDFTEAARKQGLTLARVNEFFDDGDRAGLPRILALLFKKT